MCIRDRYKGETYKPAITYGPKQGTAKWSSSKKSVAKVNSKGQITAVKKGTAYITVKINGKSAKQKITVKNAITLKKPQITTVKKASRASLKISWKKVSGANKYYLYRSSTKKGKKTKVATVKGTTYTHKYIAGRRYYYHVKAASTNKYKYKTSGDVYKRQTFQLSEFSISHATSLPNPEAPIITILFISSPISTRSSFEFLHCRRGITTNSFFFKNRFHCHK